MDFPVVGVVGLGFVLKGFEGGWDRVATVAEVALHAGGQTFPVQLLERAIRPVREEESVGVEVRGVTGDTPIVRHPKLVEGFLGDVLTITLAKLPLKFILEGCVVLHVIRERVGIEIMRGKPGESWAGKMRAGKENLLFLGVEFSGIGAEMHLQDSLPSVESAPGFASELFRVPEFERFGFARRVDFWGNTAANMGSRGDSFHDRIPKPSEEVVVKGCDGGSNRTRSDRFSCPKHWEVWKQRF